MTSFSHSTLASATAFVTATSTAWSISRCLISSSFFSQSAWAWDRASSTAWLSRWSRDSPWAISSSARTLSISWRNDYDKINEKIRANKIKINNFVFLKNCSDETRFNGTCVTTFLITEELLELSFSLLNIPFAKAFLVIQVVNLQFQYQKKKQHRVQQFDWDEKDDRRVSEERCNDATTRRQTWGMRNVYGLEQHTNFLLLLFSAFALRPRFF